jgi:opacity protein-like surface antigen
MLGRNDGLSKSLLSACVALTSMLVAQVACSAEAVEPRLEVTPFYGYQGGGVFNRKVTATSGDVTNDKATLNSSGVAAVAINWRANSEPGTQYELFYSRQSSDTKETIPTNMKVEYLHIGGTTIIGDAESRFVPFAVGGIGATRLSPDSAGGANKVTRASFNLGGGLRIPLAPHVRLRFEARGYLTWLGDNDGMFCSGCTLLPKSKTLFQYSALGGVSVSF